MSASPACPRDLVELIEAVYPRVQPSLLRIATAIVRDLAIAEEVVQDAVVAALKAAPDLKQEHEMEKYLHAVTRRKALRRRGCRGQRLLSLVSIDEIHLTGLSSDGLLGEMRCMALEYVSVLPPKLRDVMDLRMQGFTQKETGKTVGVATRTVRRRLEAARRIVAQKASDGDT